MSVSVNKNDWESLTDEQRTQIGHIIESHFHQAKITPSDAVPKSGDAIKSRQMTLDWKKPWCTAACGVAEAGAVAACSALSGGVAVAVCVAAAHAAGDLCRSRC